MTDKNPFVASTAKRDRAWEAECAKGFRSSVPTVVATHLAAIYGFRSYPSRPRTKRPTRIGWQAGASNDPKVIVAWHRAFEAPDFIILTGRENGVWILDIDGPAGRARLAALEAKYGPLPITWSVVSGRPDGGAHYWFRPTTDGPDLKSLGKALIDGKRDCIDQKGRGGYAVLPGSLHASGRRYQWAEGCAPGECELASLPDAWLAILDWADEVGASRPLPSPKRATGGSGVKIDHDPASLLIGDGPGFGGFQNPLYKNAIRYFLKAGPDAPSSIIVETLRELIVEAPKDEGRDTSRYMEGSDLPRLVERARNFVQQVKEQ